MPTLITRGEEAMLYYALLSDEMVRCVPGSKLVVTQRTVTRIESNDRHVFDLYFTPPDGKEQLELPTAYTRIE